MLEPSFSSRPTPKANAEAAPAGMMPQLYAHALGPLNAAYYQKQFARFDSLGRAVTSWNSAAAAFTLGWLVLRKLWQPAAIYASIWLLALITWLLLHARMPLHFEAAGVALTVLALSVVPGLLGNGLYWRHIHTQTLAALQASATLAQAQQSLQQRFAVDEPRLRKVIIGHAVAVAIVLLAAAGAVWWTRAASTQDTPTQTAAQPQAPAVGPPQLNFPPLKNATENAPPPTQATQPTLPVESGTAVIEHALAAQNAAIAPSVSAASTAEAQVPPAPAVDGEASAAAPTAATPAQPQLQASAHNAAAPYAPISAQPTAPAASAPNLPQNPPMTLPGPGATPPPVSPTIAAPAGPIPQPTQPSPQQPLAQTAQQPTAPSAAAVAAPTLAAPQMPAQPAAAQASPAVAAVAPQATATATPAAATPPALTPAITPQPAAARASSTPSANPSPPSQAAPTTARAQQAPSATPRNSGNNNARTAAPPTSNPTAQALISGKFYLSVGVYAEAANARRNERTLRGAGLPVISQNVSGQRGAMTRIRLGPFDTRAQAEQAQRTAARHGFETSVFQHRR